MLCRSPRARITPDAHRRTRRPCPCQSTSAKTPKRAARRRPRTGTEIGTGAVTEATGTTVIGTEIGTEIGIGIVAGGTVVMGLRAGIDERGHQGTGLLPLQRKHPQARRPWPTWPRSRKCTAPQAQASTTTPGGATTMLSASAGLGGVRMFLCICLCVEHVPFFYSNFARRGVCRTSRVGAPPRSELSMVFAPCGLDGVPPGSKLLCSAC
mmetsp:Transcript_25414/g.58561  ORF Transcript_25414/g.58561 Transcript_25414/m.58561 type:complete len:210 (+) Transcript_25414:915-1544(+)